MMPARSPEDSQFAVVRDIHSPEELELLAAELSLLASVGTAIFLHGELGSGKSTFARAFIRGLAREGTAFDIPSPTFTLMQTYDGTRLPVVHADLYRINSPAEIDELGLDDLISNHVVLIEWPERLGPVRWPNILTIAISGRGTNRTLRIAGQGTWQRALQRNETIKAFIATTAWQGAARTFFEGDASFRRFELLHKGDGTVVLMDMPARPDGPSLGDTRPYSAVAHLAENIGAVVAVSTRLGEIGYSASLVHAFDISGGLAIIEDLGRNVFVHMAGRGHDMREPMKAAVELLADMAKRDWPDTVPIGNGRTHHVPPYDETAQLAETDLLPSWFWPHMRGTPAPISIHGQFAELWSEVFPLAVPKNPGWTLRDYHSPNLLWLPDRAGIRRVGLIDTQDCVLGHPAYDLVSLLQDARVDIAVERADELFDYYCGLRSGGAGFYRSDFSTAFAVLGAQRATKILGIFARLSKRDGKHGYLKHIPRIEGYLERNLQHPDLRRMRHWFETQLPAVFQKRTP
ncbi:MAG: tRNA (adenosine(37)-N6)-threonylcarbamoyltransferase complex ATPase subunit type 1 TsaE [Rhizobiales bacterium]|nr:tRNA (adenosine(37)-N6)-threonylcarbamoyltransferase complex ATPase subunit type 1 TsaE [Hyphomicrobiales bacterium]